MYKVKQIAEMLNLETVQVHEILISYRELLHPNVVKKNSILYVDYDGYQKIKNLVKDSMLLDQNDTNSKTSVSNEYNSIIGDQLQTVTGLQHFKKYYDDIDEIKNKISLMKQEISRLDIMILREEEASEYYRGMLKGLLVQFNGE